MKRVFLLYFPIFLPILLFAQQKDYTKNFQPGYYIAADSSIQQGFLKIFPNQYGDLKFKITENAEVQKFNAKDIVGFKIDTALFYTTGDFEAYGALGIKKKVEKCFAQVVETGDIHLYLINYSDSSPLGQSVENYLNFVLERKNQKLVVPFLQRLKAKRIEKVKAELKAFFASFPELLAEIDSMSRENGLTEVVDLVKKANKSNLNNN